MPTVSARRLSFPFPSVAATSVAADGFCLRGPSVAYFSGAHYG
jgi:hypothetical protein